MKYHMRRSEKQIAEQSILDEILNQGKYATVALCKMDEPYLVTLNYGYDKANGVLYFHSAKEGLKRDFVRENPRVCATIIEDGGYIQNECDHAYRSVIIRGWMEIIEDPREKSKGVEVLIEQLEENPSIFKAKLPLKQASYDAMDIWKLHIEQLSGKWNEWKS